VRKVVVMLVLVLAGVSFGLISPSLQEHLTKAQAGRKLPVHIVLKEQFDKDLLNNLVDGMPKPQRRVEAARILKEFSAEQQAGVLGYLATTDASNVQSFWVVNAVYCEATPAIVEHLSQRFEVSYVDYDRVYCPDLPEPEQDGGGAEEIAWGVDKINAPAVWALGYTGQGIVCGHIDTGCDYTHPDLADHLWTDPNYPHHGWNFESNNDDPMDQHGHGTHTAGTVAGDGTNGTQSGVAPDAQIMICRVQNAVDSAGQSQMWAAVQFIVSPPLSPANGADLYTMSMGWAISWGPDQSTWRTLANNVSAAGVSQIVAAGNERGQYSPPTALRCPGNVPPPWWNPENTGTGALSGIVSIGATDAADAIASFSSPGPVTWSSVSPFNDYAYPPGLTRPDVSAPGVAIKSCAIGGGYQEMGGTSMATPHVAGTVCLMLSKNPTLSPAEVDSILEMTAVDLGATGKDNDFGAGRIDALAAVNYVIGYGGPLLYLQSTQVIDSTGNNNGQLDPGETAKLLVTLRNSGGAACNNVTGRFRAYDARLTVNDSTGDWGDVPSGDSATNTIDWFTVHADSAIPPETPIPCTLRCYADSGYTKVWPFTLIVGGLRASDPIPDGPRTPTLYYAYDDGDLLYTKHPTYNWVEINGVGTEMSFAQNDDVTMISLPSAFGPVKFYGQRYTQLSISADGWIACGNNTTGSFTNTQLPSSSAPRAAMFLNWDDLAPATDGTGYVYYYHDTANHRFIIEYDSVAYYGSSTVDKFEVIIYDTTVTTYTGDNAFLVQYKTANLYTSATLGIQDQTMAIGIQGLFNGAYHKACEPIAPGRAILYTTDPPMTAVTDDYGPASVPTKLELSVRPNPLRTRVSLAYAVPVEGRVSIKVYDAAGRVVRDLVSQNLAAGRYSATWDGSSADGRRIANGVYFCKLVTSIGARQQKLVVARR
jgi:subtilisin family serine protease